MTLHTPTSIAAELGVSPKAFRAWLRGQTDTRAGRGGSWTFDDATRDEILRRWAERGNFAGRRVTPVLNQPE